MTIVVSSTTPGPFAPGLLQIIDSFQVDRKFINLKLLCIDGSYMTSGLVLAAVSPVIKHIGASRPDEEDAIIVLPDFCVGQVANFVKQLTSPSPPKDEEQTETFRDMLDFFGTEPPMVVKEDHGKEVPPLPQAIKTEPTTNQDELLGVGKANWDEDSSDLFCSDEDKMDEDEDEDDDDDDPDYVKKVTLPRKMGRSKTKTCIEPNTEDTDSDGGSPNKQPRLQSEDRERLRDKVRDCLVPEKNIYICYVCGIERKGARSTQQHLIWHEKHPNEDFHTCHICKQCGKVCADYNAMKFHVRQVHCDRTLKCTYDDCFKVFKTQVALKSHLDIHAGVKNFVCSECGFAFRSKQEMKGHILRKHSNVKKSIPCEMCGKLFRHMSNLKSHFNIHKAQSERQHRCLECNVTFRSEETLQNHMTLHDPSRPFKCSKCPLRYKNKDAWVSHESTHTNPQYPCEFCDVVYTRRDNLKRHLKDKHTKLSLLDKVMMCSQE